MSYKMVVLRALVLGFALISCLPAGLGRAQEKQFASAHIRDLDGMKQRRLVRILVPYSKTIYFVDQGRQYGTAVEFGTALETALNTGKKKEIDRIHVAFFPTARDGFPR